MPCFYSPELKETDSKLIISGDEFHHIINVRRKSYNDEIYLTNGSGLMMKATITTISNKELTASIISKKVEKISEPKIAVAFSLLKNKHDFLIIEKLTELGVKEFFPIITERTIRKPSQNIVKKFEKIAISAIKQCDNAFLPNVHKVTNLSESIDLVKEKGYQPLIGLETGNYKNISEILEKIKKTVCLFIGPEGGFSKKEIENFQKDSIPFFSLGNHILRAETAAITATSQLLGLYLAKDPSYY